MTTTSQSQGLFKVATIAAQYNILEHLGNTPAQISILDLLHTRPLHQEILNNTLHKYYIPIDINAIEFKNLVGNLSTPSVLSFKPYDIPTTSYFT